MTQPHGPSRAAARHAAVEGELAAEKTSALARVGAKLTRSLHRYHQARITAASDAHQELLDEITANVWELLLQREAAGLTEGNLSWVLEGYAVPAAALRKLGRNTYGFG